ncbi:RNA-binding protein [Rhodobacterales bacterium HKCCE3408]|nr:RNA-binding protein [Rhodobacterales bacterium HKCCE3408]
MSRGGRTKDRAEPERRCIVTGETGPKPGLVRFVVGPEGEIVPDVLERLPGRGIWVTADAEAIGTAARKGLFARAAKMPVTVPADLAGTVEAMLARRVTDLVALARKAGEAVAGFEKVKDWLAGGRKVRVLLQASDGSVRGKSKLWTPTGARYFGCLTASELGLAFGRQSVIHGALAAGGLADRVVETAAKLQGLRISGGGADGGTTAGKD